MATFGAGVSSPRCMVEGQYGAPDDASPANFELCGAVGGNVEHWWRDNRGDRTWRRSAVFGRDVRAVAALTESSFGFDLEVIVLGTDNRLQHYWRDGKGRHEGVIVGPA